CFIGSERFENVCSAITKISFARDSGASQDINHRANVLGRCIGSYICAQCCHHSIVSISNEDSYFGRPEQVSRRRVEVLNAGPLPSTFACRLCKVCRSILQYLLPYIVRSPRGQQPSRCGM